MFNRSTTSITVTALLYRSAFLLYDNSVTSQPYETLDAW